jgi:hypothetical protein
MRSQAISIKVFLLFTVILFPLAPKFAPGGLQSVLAWGDDDNDRRSFPQKATFTTLITTPRALEGLTGDNHGNLYTGGSVTVATTPITPVPVGKSISTNPLSWRLGKLRPIHLLHLRLRWHCFE